MQTELQVRREALADRVTAVITAAFTKLAEHRAEIQELWDEFEKLQPGETIKGCRTKTEFCRTHIGRSLRAVQYMLAGGNHNRGETVSRTDSDDFQWDTEHEEIQDLVLRALVNEQARVLNQMSTEGPTHETVGDAARLEAEIVDHICRVGRQAEYDTVQSAYLRYMKERMNQ
jgi:hypothetical protein